MATAQKKLIEWDAKQGYRDTNIETLLRQIGEPEAVVILRNAHFFTAAAFYRLHDFVQRHKEVKFFLVSNEPDKIFPPLLDYVELLNSVDFAA